MGRVTPFLVSAAVLAAAAGGYARTKIREAPVDSTLGVKLTSRIPCDGDTNPEDQVSLKTNFSPDGWQREFRIEVFEDKFCKQGDLGFACIRKGRDLWKQEWTADSSIPTGFGNYGLRSCYDWGSKEPPQIVLTGWYKQTSEDPKAKEKQVWKQVAMKKVTGTRWETYEFSDPNGGTARIELDRR
jgi:hypothetical protein